MTSSPLNAVVKWWPHPGQCVCRSYLNSACAPAVPWKERRSGVCVATPMLHRARAAQLTLGVCGALGKSPAAPWGSGRCCGVPLVRGHLSLLSWPEPIPCRLLQTSLQTKPRSALTESDPPNNKGQRYQSSNFYAFPGDVPVAVHLPRRTEVSRAPAGFALSAPAQNCPRPFAGGKARLGSAAERHPAHSHLQATRGLSCPQVCSLE